MAISTFKRYERKFLVTREQYKSMLPRILEHMEPDKYCLDDKTYPLVNLYFDDDNDDIIRYSVSSPKFKQKLRLRCYGTPENDGATVYMEIKSKTYGTVTKRRVGMTLREANEYIYNGVRPTTEKYLSSQVLDEIDYFRSITPCYPKLYVSYERRALFMRGDSDVRVTFDDNILTRRTDLDVLHGMYGKRIFPEGVFIMEVKVPDAIPLWLARILSDNGAAMTSISKYGKEYELYVTSGAKAESVKNRIPVCGTAAVPGINKNSAPARSLKEGCSYATNN